MPKIFHAVFPDETVSFLSEMDRATFLSRLRDSEPVLCDSEISQEDFDYLREASEDDPADGSDGMSVQNDTGE